MFDSGISVSDIVSELKLEIDIAIPISNASYVLWENALEQLLYRELIQEQCELVLKGEEIYEKSIDLAEHTPTGEAAIRFEDIHAVFADETQLIKTTLTSSAIFSDCYYRISERLGYNSSATPNELRIIYYVKPEPKTVDAGDIISQGNVMLPIEFVDLVKAKLRAEAYKVANEDAIAAKWVNDYNVLLETFKAWISEKKPEFGM